MRIDGQQRMREVESQGLGRIRGQIERAGRKVVEASKIVSEKSRLRAEGITESFGFIDLRRGDRR